MNGWNESATAWIEAMGERGDWGREHVLDPVMLKRLDEGSYQRALDVGCGEGRFCRMLSARGIDAVGIDPTKLLIETARRRDPQGHYQVAEAEKLPLDTDSFDLVVSYLTLIDIRDFRVALREMVRVLKPGGSLLIANLNSFVSARPHGWVKDEEGRDLHYAVDRYLEEFPEWVDFRGIRIQNWHRPFSAYMKELLGLGLMLTFFDEPAPRAGCEERQARYRRVPWFMIMEWQRPA